MFPPSSCPQEYLIGLSVSACCLVLEDRSVPASDASVPSLPVPTGVPDRPQCVGVLSGAGGPLCAGQ